MNHVIYEELPDFDKAQLQEELDSQDPERIVAALLSMAMNGEDYAFTSSALQRFAEHPNEYVRGCVVECLGHLSRLYPFKLDQELLHPILSAGKEDQSLWVRQKTEDALGDIAFFEGKK